jgi:transcriptional regulator with XRE-family HTH domain
MAASNNLKNIRTAEGFSITQLATLSGVSVRTLRRIEGATRNVAPSTKHRIIKALNKKPSRGKGFDLAEVFPNDKQENRQNPHKVPENPDKGGDLPEEQESL